MVKFKKLRTEIINNKLNYLLLFLFLIIPFFSSFCFKYPYPFYYNNFLLNKFSNEFERLPFPTETTQLGKIYKKFGNLAGASNSGGFFAAMLISSNLGLEEIESFYLDKIVSQVKSPRAWGTKNGPNKIYVKKFNYSVNDLYPEKIDYFYPISSEILPKKHFKLSYDWKNKHKFKYLYLVYIKDNPYPPTDFRCY